MAQRISQKAVVEAALAALDDGGAQAVTVRAVAARLGVQAPALYYHVRSKQHLLDEMGTEITRRVVAALTERTPDGDWLHDLAAYGHALRDEYLLHRDGARTFSGTLITDPAVLRAQEPWFRRWSDDGIPVAAIFDAVEVVTAFVTGFVIEEQERLQSAGDPERYSPEARRSRVGDDAPLVARAGYERAEPGRRFDRQLEAVIRGIAQVHDRADDAADGREGGL
ncbi:TetR/AcrR family transcriptional regulator [Herbiconiux sp. KACC 21604]|uniref:TetR/AcrR family transcriptional regulator n=1 Tax=unclassified Herbiconiux TaxID=2618217 RepID=UPI001492B7EF|nr:TetR/AcrR family transcriptional regulator [Herbiconiux sp. SALV-R1]QJU55684.1 TetR/AcrR family transcriptional regulator [Herbiconiux sp. SALV-R1]WPO86887.1 TetR/AcrR family transcriptional regulator [Herbiconiux sp. KACC 21604]